MELLFPYFMIALIFAGPNFISVVISFIKNDDDKYTFGFKKAKFIGKPSPVAYEAIEIFSEKVRYSQKKRVLKQVLECRFGNLTFDQDETINEMNLFELDIMIDHVFVSCNLDDLIAFNFIEGAM